MLFVGDDVEPVGDADGDAGLGEEGAELAAMVGLVVEAVDDETVEVFVAGDAFQSVQLF